MITFKVDPGKTESDAIIGLLLTLSKQNTSAKAAQIEAVAKSNKKKHQAIVTVGIHTHGPAPAGVNWFTISLEDGDDTPETIHIYVDDFGGYLQMNSAPVAAIGKPAGASISVENTLRQGLDWY